MNLIFINKLYSAIMLISEWMGMLNNKLSLMHSQKVTVGWRFYTLAKLFHTKLSHYKLLEIGFQVQCIPKKSLFGGDFTLAFSSREGLWLSHYILCFGLNWIIWTTMTCSFNRTALRAIESKRYWIFYATDLRSWLPHVEVISTGHSDRTIRPG